MNEKNYGNTECRKHLGADAGVIERVRCRACGYITARNRLRHVWRPPDPDPYFICPDCGGEDVEDLIVFRRD